MAQTYRFGPFAVDPVIDDAPHVLDLRAVRELAVRMSEAVA